MVFPFSYLLWYYTGGLVSLLRIWWNFLRFVPRMFSVGELLFTLASPWKRDVSPKTWRGFSIVMSVERFVSNILSRFIGMVVRIIMIVIGTIATVFMFCISASLLVLWLVALPMSFFVLYSLSIGREISELEFVAFVLVLAMVVLSLVAYVMRLPDEFLPKNRADLFRKKWFPRVLGRLGLTAKEFRAEEWLTDEQLENRLEQLNISHETFDEIVSYEADAARRRARVSRFWLWENMRKKAPFARGWQYGYTVRLDKYSVDLSMGDPSEYGSLHLFGRDNELQVTTLVMHRPGQNSVLLIGDTGIGKKTFVHALARKIREGDIPEFAHLRFVLFDLGLAVGDALNRGEDLENFLRYMFHQAAYAGNVVLVIENLDTFLGAGGSAAHQNLAALFSEFLALPTFRVIGTMSTSRYHDIVRNDESVVKFFEAVYLQEPDESTTVRIILNNIEREERSRVLFTWKALSSIVQMSGEYNWDVAYPEKAIDLAQQTMLHWSSDPHSYFIVPETVMTFVSLKTGIPIGSLGEPEKDKLLHLEEILHDRVVGQHEAVTQVAEALRRARAGFGDPKRPLGSFLFLGPTGVGKTETAKALSEAYFGDEERMIRLDMSEYQGPDASERLIGSSTTGEVGHLIELIRNHPYGVILLDEIEKAYPKALDIFLQVLDEGFVTDGFGKKINFRKSIIIATSNASSTLIAEVLGHGATPQQAKQEVIADIVKSQTFRLEFMNRFDSIVFFAPLQESELANVVGIKLAALAVRIKKQKNITLAFEPAVAQAIVAHGYEPAFGARSLNRYIEDHIEDVIVKKVLSGGVKDGGSVEIALADLN